MNLQETFETLKSNVFPQMLEDLSARLGVSVEAIKTIGVGFYPAFQSWVTAEYDDKGNIIGLLSRMPDNSKLAWANSKRGLIYRIGSKKYGSLLEDFVRVSEAGVNCPICGKPDWCLVSRNNPSNPDLVICPRIKEGGQPIGEAGYLHKQQDNRTNSNKMFQNLRGPILIVEGWSDVCAAYDLGFDAIGRPSAEGGLNLLAKKVQGTEVCIIGENDSGAGEMGMNTAHSKLAKYCKSATKIMPPHGVKDLREWLRNGLTHDELLGYIEKGDRTTDLTLLDNPVPLGIAGRWISEEFTDMGTLLLRHYRNDFYKFDGVKYSVIDDDVMSQQLYNYLKDKWYIHPEKNKRVPYVVDKQKLDKIKHACLAQTQLPDIDEPFIIGNDSCVLDKETNIIFNNGIFNINTGKTSQVSSNLFSTSTLPYDYKENEDCPLWRKTVGQWFNNNKECELLLAQWFGYNLIAVQKWEKMMIFYGLPGSGKSTVTNILFELLGQDRCTAIDFSDMSYTFGLNGLVGKYAAILSEDQTTKRMDSGFILQVLKRLTGRNLISIKRKYKESYTAKLFARLTLETNELPRLVDNPQALRRRILFLCFNNSFEDSPDITLKDQLKKELPGIANWAICGLKDLLKRGDFIEPGSSTQARHELKMMTSPIAAMIDECCNLNNTTAVLDKEQLYELHKVWFRENGYSLYNRIWFARVLKVAVPKLQECRPLLNGTQVLCWKGIEINTDAKRVYMGHP